MRYEQVSVCWACSPLMLAPVGRRRMDEQASIARADQEEALPVLWDAVVGGIQDLVAQRVAKLEDPVPESIEERCRLILVGQPEDVFHEERRGPKRLEEAEVVLEQIGFGIASFALVLEMEAGLRECDAGWPADKKIHLSLLEPDLAHDDLGVGLRDVERLGLWEIGEEDACDSDSGSRRLAGHSRRRR